jgi:hypothetical protein
VQATPDGPLGVVKMPPRPAVRVREVARTARANGPDEKSEAEQDPLLLVVPPDTTPEAARAAMAQGVRADNVTQANQLLIDTASAQAPPE